MKRLWRLTPRGYGPADWLLAFVGPLGLLWALEGFSRGDAGAVAVWAAQQPGLFLANYALYLGVGLLLCMLPARRARFAGMLALGLACALLGIANRYKIFYRMEPILFTDVTQLADAGQAATGLGLDINFAEIAWVCGGFAVLIAAALLLARGRASGGVLLPALGMTLMLGLWPLCTFSLAGAEGRSDMVDHARMDGTLYAAIAMENHRQALMRVDYEEQAVRARYRELAGRVCAAEAKEQPNIVVILSESFADEAWLRSYIDLDRELMPFYNRLIETCEHGRLYVPKLGGGTSETEFEVLTGLRSQYVINPYSMGLPPLNSLASVLRQKGYAATAIHWFTGVYYNRYNNLRMLGFDSFFTTDTTDAPFEKKGMYVSDQEHYRAVLRRLEATEERDFIFCLTMQNHGAYDDEDFREKYGAEPPFSGEMSEHSRTVLNNYCWLLEQSDAALASLITELERAEEPTLVVFFGDHIPPLGTDVYEETGISATGDEGHLTPYFIWSNRGNAPVETNLYAWQLGALALTRAGLNDDPFFHYIEERRKADGDKAQEDLTGAGQSDALYDLLSYDALFGKQHAYAQGGLSPENPDFQIGGEMALEGFDAVRIADGIYVRPKLAVPYQKYLLEVNGARRDVSCIQADEQGPLTLRCIMPNGSRKAHNQSNVLVYDSAAELLEQSGELPYETYPLWEEPFEPAQEGASRELAVFRSRRAFPVTGGTALTGNGHRWEWQPVYGLTRAGQYGVDEQGHIWIVLSQKEMEGGSVTGALRQKNAKLHVFEDE